jgi:ubiquitin
MQLLVKAFTGKTAVLEVDSSDTIDNIKSKIEEEQGIPQEQQRLAFAGNLLEGCGTLSEHAVRENDTLRLIWRLRGGGREGYN